jgi:uncharacterized protein (DUF1501 family)
MSTNHDRRHFLRTATGLAGLAALSAQTSIAADASGPYRALVCLFLHGGSDMHNWVVPIDAEGYAEYAAVRRELAWPLARLQPITTSGQAAGRAFGMPVELQPLRKWYEAGQAAIVANVGTLLRPVSVAEFHAGVELPSKLFSHNDQASTWQSLMPEGARSGWGGRLGDLLMAANPYPVFTAVSATGNAVFLAGNAVTPYQIGLDGPVAVGGLAGGPMFGSTSAPAALRRSLLAAGGNPFQAEHAKIMQRSLDAGAVIAGALQGTAVPAIPNTVIPLGGGGSITLSADSLAQQLRIVAKMMGAGQALGMKRQVFMVSMGGFDTHANQMRDQPSTMARVAQSVDYFLNAVATMGLLNQVTLFSASDFGRTLSSNGSGSDHGWGSHHFVAGGAVKGRTIYGRFPVTALGTEDDIGSGRLLPAISVSEHAATLGRWMGLSSGDLATVLPGLGNFGAPPAFL